MFAKRFTTIHWVGLTLIACGMLLLPLQATRGASDATDEEAVVLYRFRGNGKDASGNGHDLTIEHAQWNTVGGTKHGLKFAGDGVTKAFLDEQIDDLNFGRDDFTIYVDVQLEENPKYGSWTIMETYTGPTGPGFSLELTHLDADRSRWQFHFNNNGTASYDGEAATMQKRTKLCIVREKGRLSIFADGRLKFGPKEMPNAPDDGGPLHFGYRAGPQMHYCLGTLWKAGVWRTAFDKARIESLAADGRD